LNFPAIIPQIIDFAAIPELSTGRDPGATLAIGGVLRCHKYRKSERESSFGDVIVAENFPQSQSQEISCHRHAQTTCANNRTQFSVDHRPTVKVARTVETGDSVLREAA
jgi:hypothetical protein